MGQHTTAGPADIPRADELDVLQHELGNVLYGITCVARLLRESDLGAQQRRWLAAIERACAQMRDMLDGPRRAAGAARPRVRVLNGIRMLEDTVLSHAPAAADKGIELLLCVAPDLPVDWRSDPCLLRQLLDNLVGNAVRHTAGGVVVLEAARDGAAPRAVRVAVLDSGPGIVDCEGVFESRRRGARAQTGTRGQGLGLWVCRRLVEGFGGTLTCRNRRAGGARFEFVLPATLEHPAVGDSCVACLPALACRLDLDADWARSIGGFLDRLGVQWWRRGDPDRTPGAVATVCTIRRARRSDGAAAGGVLIESASGARLGVPAPVFESSLMNALARLPAAQRRGRVSPSGAPD